MTSHDNKRRLRDLVVGDQLYYRPKGNVLMEVIEIVGSIQEKTVKLVDVEAFRCNNRQLDGINFISVPMEIAKIFWRKEEMEKWRSLTRLV